MTNKTQAKLVCTATENGMEVTAEYTKEYFDFMEVRPINKGKYHVTLYMADIDSYIKTDLEYDGNNWDYGKYKSIGYVCFVHCYSK